MNKDIADLFESYDEYDDFITMLDKVAMKYDQKYTSYPENMYEGLAVLCFATGENDYEESEAWQERIGEKVGD